MKKIKTIGTIILILILGIIFKSFNPIGQTQAKTMDEITTSMYLNPEWVEYSNLSEEEQLKYDVIPEKYLINYDEITATKKGFNGFIQGAETNSYYNLMDENLVTSPRDQGGTGLCWAFASISSVESNMLISGLSNQNDPLIFSERQLDYATVHGQYLKEGYSPYYLYGRYYLGTGAYTITPYQVFSVGVSPITTDKFGEWNESKETKSISEVLDSELIDYVVDGYYVIGGVTSSTTDSVRQAFVQAVKEHVVQYGSVTIGTIGPHPYYAGSCIYLDQEKGNYLLNDLGDCNPKITENGHAMSIIGWDDDYEYQYCRTSTGTSDDLENCSNIVSETGAFILKNSWGDNTAYPYLAYTSNINSVIGVTGVREKDFQTNYELRRQFEESYGYSTSIITYQKSSKINEVLKRISFYNKRATGGLTYNVYISTNNGSSYTKIGSTVTTYIGTYSVDIDDYKLNGDNFTIKITSNYGYASEIYAFTDYLEENTETIIDTKLLNGNKYSNFITNMDVLTITRNIPTGELLQYQLLDESGVDISSLMIVENNVVLNNAVTPQITFSERINSSTATLNTIYNGEIVASNSFTIIKIEDYFQEGTGSEEEPIIINSLEEFFNIKENSSLLSLNYKLGVDLDFSTIEDYNTIQNFTTQAFTGTLDGDGHSLKGLKCSNAWCSIFYATENAVIENLVISDFEINNTSSYSSFLVYLAKYTKFSNITILSNNTLTTEATYSGGLAILAYDSLFYRVSNYANLESLASSTSGYIGGILGRGYGCKIEESYNYGNITAAKAKAGGLIGELSDNTDTGMHGDINNSYNRGNIISSFISGGLIGRVGNTVLTTSYSTSNKVRECELENNCAYGNLIGVSYTNSMQNLYYLENDNNALIFYSQTNLEQSNLKNIIGLSDSALKEATNYENFDFENVWKIEEEYAFLKNNHYEIVSELIVATELLLEVGESQKIEIEIKPEYAKENQIQYSIENESIATIDNSGNITALKRGSTTAYIDTIDGSNLHYEIQIKVTEKSITIQKYQVIDNKYIPITPLTDEEEFLSNIIKTSEDYQVEIIKKKEKLSTGDILNVYYLEEELVDSYIISVLGDVTGSGTVHVGDIAKTFQYIKGKIDMEKEYQIAADVTNDEKVKLNDIIKIFQYIKGKIESLGEEA